jgi:transposase
MALAVRALTSEEAGEIERLARSRTALARLVERARMIRLAAGGRHPPAIARELGVGVETVRQRLKRFNERGLDGLADAPRSGRPATYSAEQVGEVIAAALTDPRTLGLPFASWTLDRLEAYLNEEKGIAIKRTRIDDLLLDEGLRWRTQETWFGERAALAGGAAAEGGAALAPGAAAAGAGKEQAVDPEFARKRGPARSSTPRRRRVA